jgi:hypothetical protein
MSGRAIHFDDTADVADVVDEERATGEEGESPPAFSDGFLFEGTGNSDDKSIEEIVNTRGGGTGSDADSAIVSLEDWVSLAQEEGEEDEYSSSAAEEGSEVGSVGSDWGNQAAPSLADHQPSTMVDVSPSASRVRGLSVTDLTKMVDLSPSFYCRVIFTRTYRSKKYRAV